MAFNFTNKFRTAFGNRPTPKAGFKQPLQQAPAQPTPQVGPPLTAAQPVPQVGEGLTANQPPKVPPVGGVQPGLQAPQGIMDLLQNAQPSGQGFTGSRITPAVPQTQPTGQVGAPAVNPGASQPINAPVGQEVLPVTTPGTQQQPNQGGFGGILQRFRQQQGNPQQRPFRSMMNRGRF